MTEPHNPLDNIPQSLREIPHWISWKAIDGKKVPNARINDPSSWLPFSQVQAVPIGESGGIGFVFTEGNDLGGVDLDGCRDPKTGALTKWAEAIVKAFNSYTEVSPSGSGVKIWAKGAPPKLSPNMVPMSGEAINGKSPAVEAYTHSRYFAVTGQHLEGTPKEVNSSPRAWLNMVKFLQDNQPGGKASPTAQGRQQAPDVTGGRNTTLTSLAGAMRKRGMDEDTILIALRAENAKRYAGNPLPEKELLTIAKSVCRYKPELFVKNEKGAIVANHQDNIQTALDQLDIKLSYDIFADRKLYKQGDKETEVLDDPQIDDIWLNVDKSLGFRPTKDFFNIVIENIARKSVFHPVRDYLNKLQWDKTPRLDRWLITYGGASDSDYAQAVGALVLIAAVRRVRNPGVKFDELLVLESPQGSLKSSAFKALCLEESWFTDDLPLNVESKEVIERTKGKWIVEASELSGMKRSDIEHLKSFLSRQVDTARLSYQRLTTERPRHFIMIGTTNSDEYLMDSTGNRRFWPLRTGKFDIEGLFRDRDQLWAEAAFRESQGESIRLKPELWPAAAIQQERRRAMDPWEERIHSILGDIKGKLLCEKAWELIGVEINRRTQGEAMRLGQCMKRLGFERKKKSAGKDNPKWHYVKGTPEEQDLRIVVEFDSETTEVTAKNHRDHSPK